MIATMMSTVNNVRIMDDALSIWSQSKTSIVTHAYSAILELEQRELGTNIVPRNHMFWIDALAREGGVHILPRSCLDDCISTIADGVNAIDKAISDDVSFDPREHIVVTTQLTLLSYLVDTSTPAKVPLLGDGAMGMSSDFKNCVVWWNA